MSFRNSRCSSGSCRAVANFSANDVTHSGRASSSASMASEIRRLRLRPGLNWLRPSEFGVGPPGWKWPASSRRGTIALDMQNEPREPKYLNQFERSLPQHSRIGQQFQHIRVGNGAESRIGPPWESQPRKALTPSSRHSGRVGSGAEGTLLEELPDPHPNTAPLRLLFFKLQRVAKTSPLGSSDVSNNQSACGRLARPKGANRRTTPQLHHWTEEPRGRLGPRGAQVCRCRSLQPSQQEPLDRGVGPKSRKAPHTPQ